MRRLLVCLLALLPFAVQAAAPVVEARATTAATSTNATSLTVTRATVASGQLQYCVAIVDNDTATTMTWPGTFTVIEAIEESGDFRMEAAVESMSGGESATFSLSFSTSQMSAARCYAISGGSGTTTEASNTEATAVTSIDPAAVSGLTSGDYLFISAAGWDQWKDINTFPTGYSQTGNTWQSGTANSVSLGWAEKSATSTTGDNPSVFSHATSADQAGAITVAFHAAPSGPALTLSDATPDIDTTVTATLSGAFGAGGNPTTVTLSSGDTVQCDSSTSTTCTFTPAWDDLQPGAGSTFDFTDRDLGGLSPYFARTGAQTGVAVDGTLETVDRSNNLFTYSTNMTIAPWSLLAASRVDNGDGTFTLTEDSSNNRHFIYRSLTGITSDQYHTFALDAKAGTRNYISMGLKQITGAQPLYAVNVDLTDGTVTDTFTVGSPADTGHTVTDLGGGWYRISVTIQGPTASMYAELGISNSATPAWSGAVANYLGDSTGSIHLRHPQMNEGATALPYHATGSDNAAPAFDGANGWLAEEGRTNLWPDSDLTNPLLARVGVTVSSPDGTDPLGAAMGNMRITATSASQPRVEEAFTPPTTDTTYTFSVYVANDGSRPYAALSNFQGTPGNNTPLVVYNLEGDGSVSSNGEEDAAGIERLSNSRWYRIWLTDTVAANSQYSIWKLLQTNGVGALVGVVGEYLDYAFPQLEVGAFRSSVIPTEGATATRQPTTLSGVPASVWAPGAGAITNDVAFAVSLIRRTPYNVPQGYGRFLCLSSADGNERIEIHNSNGDSTIFTTKYSGGSSIESIGSATANHQVDIGDPQLLVGRMSSAGFKMWITTDVQTTHEETTANWQSDFGAPLTELHIGERNAGGNKVRAEIFNGLKIWTGADVPSDAELAALTADDLTEALNGTGELAKTQLQTGYTVTLTNGTETSQSTAINIQIPASGYAIVDLTCTAGVDCTADSEAISPMVAGDDCAIKVTSGALSSLSTHCAPVFSSPAFAYTVARFDESATAWLSQEEVTVTAPVSCRKAVSSAVHSAVQSAAQEAACLLNVSRP